MSGAIPERRCVSGIRDIGCGGDPAVRLLGLTPYDGVRIALAMLLLTAAALKGYQLATEPVAETSLLNSRWFLIAVVEFELSCGLWLIAGFYPRWTWRAAAVCFGGFACVSLYKAISGEATCGCFGRVPLNPWHTFTLDITAVAALMWWRPLERGEPVSGSHRFLHLGPAGLLATCLVMDK